MIETISQSVKKAKKEHKCSWCHGTIKVGEEYGNSTFKSPDHGLYVWKNHIKCHELVDGLDMWSNSWDDGVSDDAFGECLQEYLHDNNWFIDDEDLETGLDAHEKFSDWFDDVRYEGMAIKAYEIMKEKENG